MFIGFTFPSSIQLQTLKENKKKTFFNFNDRVNSNKKIHVKVTTIHLNIHSLKKTFEKHHHDDYTNIYRKLKI